jgi:hypothetical protein
MPKSLVSPPDGWVDERTMRSHCFQDDPSFLPYWSLRLVCEKRQFPHLRIGKRLYFKIAEVQAYLDRNHVRPEECAAR